MRRLARFLPVVLAYLAMASMARAERAQEVVGHWLTQDHEGVVAIEPCGEGLCGRVVGMDAPFAADGRPVTDRQGRPQCGLGILQESIETQPGLWHGVITNPNDGTDWRCEFWIVGDTLHLRGYVLVPLLGQTQVWTRYAGALQPDCRMD